MIPRTLERTAVVLAVTGLFVSIFTTVALSAGVAGQTSVRLEPDTNQLSVQETTTVQVIATNVDGGVGAYNATVSLDAPHATITNASVANARFKRVRVADDGSSVHIAAALMDTADKGAVTIATLTVEGVTAGTSTVSIRVDALADKEGRTYQVASTPETSMTITKPSTPSAGGTTAEASTAGGSAGGTGAGGETPASEYPGSGSPTVDAKDQATSEADDGDWWEVTQVGPSQVTMAGLAILACAVVAGLLVRRHL